MTPEEIKLQEENTKILMDIRGRYEALEKNQITKGDLEQFKSNIETKWSEVDRELALIKSPKIEVNDKEPSLYSKAFDKFLRSGDMRNLAPEEQKVLTIADTTHAGMLAPPEYTPQILHYAYVQHPFRQVANIRQTDRERVYLNTNDAYGVATWEVESATKAETTGLTYAQTTCIPQEMKILYKATQKMLEDSMFDLSAEIAYAAGRAFGNLESTAFYSGNGTTTGPEGISINATIVADMNPVNTDNTLSFDDFIDTQYLLEEPYIPNASWLMNRSTLGVCVSLKSATTNTYLLVPNLQAGQPSTILGSPVYTWAAMPALAAATGISDATYIALYGDFRQGYTIVDRIGITIQRLNELYAAAGMVGFYVRMRVGGAVVIPPAVQLLKNITT